MKYCSKAPEDIIKKRTSKAEKRKAADKRYNDKVKGKRKKKSSDNQN